MTGQYADIESIFDRAIEIDSPELRRAYLDGACGSDRELRARVEALLRANKDAGSFLEKPPEGLAATIAAGKVDTVDEGLGEVSLDFLGRSQKANCLGTLGQYEVVEVVGRGGMGVVLRAYDTKLNRVVAIKAMAPELAANPMATKRFLREARAAAAVSHDHVVTIHAIEEENRPPFIAMEFVDGQSLQQKLDSEGALEVEEILRIGMQTAAGLEAAHKQGLVHRDIKPANILLENSIERVKISDFGLARAVDDVSVTRTGQISGTPQYMSPEQAQGNPVDARSDLFSLGSVVYTMCTGRPPFRAESAVATLRRVCDDVPRPIREVNAACPEWLSRIVEHLLAKHPANRFQSAQEVADVLGSHLAHLQQPQIHPRPKPIARSRSQWSSSFRQRWSPKGVLQSPVRVAAVVLLSVCLILAATEFAGVTHLWQSLTTRGRGEGVLIVEVDGPDVSVAITGDGISSLSFGPQERILPSGQYKVIASKPPWFYNGIVFVTPGNTTVVKARRKEEVKSTLDGESDLDSSAVETKPPSELPRDAHDIVYLQRFDGHTGVINDVDILHNGGRVISASRDGTVRMWQVHSGTQSFQLDTTMPLTQVAIPFVEERTLAVANEDGVVQLWSTNGAQTKELREFGKFDARVLNLEFSPNRERLFAVAGDPNSTNPSEIRTWNVETGEKVSYLSDYRGVITARWTSNGGFAAGTFDNQFYVWDGGSQGANKIEVKNLPIATSMAISPDGRYALVGGSDKIIRLHDLSGEQSIRKFVGLDKPAQVLSFVPHSPLFVAGSGGSTISLWSTQTGKQVARVESEQFAARCLDVSPNGRYFVSAGGEHVNANGDIERITTPSIFMWSLPEIRAGSGDSEFHVVRHFAGHTFGSDGRLTLSRDYRYLITHDGGIRIWDVESGQAYKAINNFPVREVACAEYVNHDPRMLAIGKTDGTIQIWNTQFNLEHRKLSGHVGTLQSLSLSPGGKKLAASSYKGDKGDAKIWDLATFESSTLIDEPTKRILFTHDGKWVVTASQGDRGTIRIWDSATRRQIASFENILSDSQKILDVAISPDDRLLAVAGGNWRDKSGQLVVIDMVDNKVRNRIHDDKSAFGAATFAENGKVLACADGLGNVLFLDSSTSKELNRFTAYVPRFQGLGRGIYGLAFSDDGRRLFTAAANDDAKLWQLPECLWSSPPRTDAGNMTPMR
jgi:serine/threonine protein kinase/WD40 repeat protein